MIWDGRVYTAVRWIVFGDLRGTDWRGRSRQEIRETLRSRCGREGVVSSSFCQRKSGWTRRLLRIIEKRESIGASVWSTFFYLIARSILAALNFHGANALSNNTKFNIPGKCRYKYNRVPILSVAIVHSASPPFFSY